MNSLSQLNQSQQQAVLSDKGPVLIIAGAGTGKTRTLTHRIAYLIQEKKIKPSSILAVTFTNKAAREMLERVERLIGESSFSRPMIGTFHSVSVRILRAHIDKIGYEKNFSIYDTADQLKVIKDLLKRQNIDPKKFAPKALLNIISGAKSELMSPEEYHGVAFEPLAQKAALIYPLYQAELKKSNAVDFDDILFFAVKIFREYPEVLEYYQNLWPYIHVDEYQDTNHAQYVWIKLLSEMYENLCVVGDDWQGIYSWRGANIQNILNFKKDFPQAQVYKLEENYRSTDVILASAESVIKKNTNRTEKTLRAQKKEGEKITLHKCSSEKNEGDICLETIQKHIERGDISSWKEAVVLYRTNAQSRAIEEACIRNQVPYQIIGGVRFYDRKEIKDILAYLLFLNNTKNEVALSRIVNVPTRGIGQTTWEKVLHVARERNVNVWDVLKESEDEGVFAPRVQTKLTSFINLMKQLLLFSKTNTVSELIAEVVKRTGYDLFIDDRTQEAKNRLENIQELFSVATKYDGMKEEGLSLFLEEVGLITSMDEKREEDMLTLMTMHAAKGLEFDVVCVVGVEENLFPSARSVFDQEALEEERRLCYVAITRAKDFCHLFYCHSRMLYGQIQSNKHSRFLEDIPEEFVTGDTLSSSFSGQSFEYNYTPDEDFYDDLETTSFVKNQVVTHPNFGKGVILNVQGDILEIKFSAGVKKLVASLAPLR